MGKPILMGRKTFESLGSKPLPGRINIVITRDQQFNSPGVFVAHDLADAWHMAESHAVDEIMVIGGATIYEQALPLADRLYLTFIQLNINGDAYFPDISAYRWKEIESHSFRPDASNPYNYSFVTYDRLPNPQAKVVNAGDQTKKLNWDIL
jgi:dihydrofolate reductase